MHQCFSLFKHDLLECTPWQCCRMCSLDFPKSLYSQYMSCILEHYGHAQSQGGRQPARRIPPHMLTREPPKTPIWTRFWTVFEITRAEVHHSPRFFLHVPQLTRPCRPCRGWRRPGLRCVPGASPSFDVLAKYLLQSQVSTHAYGCTSVWYGICVGSSRNFANNSKRIPYSLLNNLCSLYIIERLFVHNFQVA